MDEIKRWWYDLTSEKQTRYKKLAIIFCILIFSYIGYCLNRKSAIQPKPNIIEQIPSLGSDALDHDIRASVEDKLEKSLKQYKETIETLQQEVKELKELASFDKENALKSQDVENFMPKYSTNFPEGQTHLQNMAPSESLQNNTIQAPEENRKILVGNIKFVAGTKNLQQNLPVKKNKIFLPPSFMRAKLLTGIDAKTSQLGESQPEPIMLRVQAPAVLPNSLKANLRGCFIVADAVGNLAKERVEVRLQSLSCLNQDGTAVISQPISGFVTDSDGRKDIAGIVVARFGSNLARSFAAGLLGNIGNVIQAQNTNTGLNPLSPNQSPKTKQILKYGVGGGLASTTNELQQFYLDLAKNSMPVIEVGASKDLTVVVQSGVELDIKEY